MQPISQTTYDLNNEPYMSKLFWTIRIPNQSTIQILT